MRTDFLVGTTNFAFGDESLGESLVATGDVPEALKHIREGLAVFEAAAASKSKDRYVSSGPCRVLLRVGLGLFGFGGQCKGLCCSQNKELAGSTGLVSKELRNLD
jgi:hypothetical protein